MPTDDDEHKPKPGDKPDDGSDEHKPKPGDKPDDGSDEDGEDPKWKSLSRKHEAEARKTKKELDDARSKLKEIEDAGKSETEKERERATTESSARAAAESKLLRLEVALEKGLTSKQSARLVGTTREELEDDADELLEEIGVADKPPKPGGRPKERLRGGGEPNEDPEEMNPRKLAAQIPRGQ